MPKKSPLQDAYEKVLGFGVHPRTFRRIANEYLKGKANLKTVKTLAILRLANGNRHISIEDVERFEWLSEFADGVTGYVQGSDLIQSLKRLDPAPCDRTIRNWGNQIGVPLRPNDWYSAQEVQVWIKKLASQTRFKPRK